MNTSNKSFLRTGFLLAVSFLLVATVAVWQRAFVIIKNAISDSGKLRQTADSCNESQDSNSAHFTGCSSIL